MKISGKRDYMVSLESVTMTDIVLNMFIFFFISFSLLYTFSPNRVQKLEVKLPEAKNLTPITNQNQVDITITDKGDLYLDKELVTQRSLKEKMSSMHKNNPNINVILHSDKTVQFKEVVKVLDTLSELGVKNLNIAAVTE